MFSSCTTLLRANTVLRHLSSILFPMELRYWIEKNVKKLWKDGDGSNLKLIKRLRNVAKYLIIRTFAEQADRRLCCFTNTLITLVIFTFIRIKTSDIDHALLNNWQASRWSDWLSRVDILTNGDSCVYCFKTLFQCNFSIVIDIFNSPALLDFTKKITRLWKDDDGSSLQ